MKITKEIFEKKVGRAPVEDDLARSNCKLAGQGGHLSCGWCKTHDTPEFLCGCRVRKLNQSRKVKF